MGIAELEKADPLKNPIRQLREAAISLGATRAKVIPASAIVLDERARLKCFVPLCDKYNHYRMCPPHLPSVEEFRKMLKKYSKALFVQLVLEKRRKISEAEARRHGLKLQNMIHTLEKKAFSLNFPMAAGLIGGSCKLCRTCTGIQRPCRHPFMARPSMEGMGIDVIKTAEKIGLPFSFLTSECLVWNGLVLID